MRLLIDMNLTPRWVPYLSDAGHQCQHWSEIGSITASDALICAYARERNFVIVTNDLDFPQILRLTLRTISLRLPVSMIEDLKVLANKRDVPYQSLLTVFLAERLDKERRRS